MALIGVKKRIKQRQGDFQVQRTWSRGGVQIEREEIFFGGTKRLKAN